MARVKGALNARKRHKKVLKLARMSFDQSVAIAHIIVRENKTKYKKRRNFNVADKKIKFNT